MQKKWENTYTSRFHTVKKKTVSDTKYTLHKSNSKLYTAEENFNKHKDNSKQQLSKMKHREKKEEKNNW